MKTQITALLLLLTITFTALRMDSYGQTTSKMYVVENSPKFLPSELISKEVRDVNGEVCSAIIISTDLDGLSFQAYNGIVKVNSKPGRHFIFVSPTERVVEVFKSGYEPLKIILNNYGIKLKSGQTWQIKITGDKKASDLISISIIAEPTGAEIFIDGISKGIGTTFKVSKGEHEIKFVKRGYKTTTKTINVSDSNILFNNRLKNVELATVTIKSKPSEATILINGVEEDKTNAQLFKYPGKYKLRLTKSGFLDIEKEIEIKENGNNTFTYILNKNTATLNLQVTPSTAQILINKKDYSNRSTIELAPGKYQIEINKDGYEPQIEQIELTLGKSITKIYSLIQQTGKLQFKVKPIDAKVTLKQNGVIKYNWTGAKILSNIPVGTYILECKLNGYKLETKQIAITKEKITIESIKLNKGISSAIQSSNQMVYVKGGTFQMGSNESNDEKPLHSVTVSNFYISKYEVTFAEYDKFCVATGRSKPNDNGWGRGNRPVINVSWHDAVAYCKWAGGRLPTEAEWEYASRGGASATLSHLYSGSDNIDEVAWYNLNSGSKTHEVGTKQPNELGIYDMSGNVWEWCSDWYSDSYYSSSPSNNPKGPSSGTDDRVLRGGSWSSDDGSCRSAYRSRFYPTLSSYYFGFRFAQD